MVRNMASQYARLALGWVFFCGMVPAGSAAVLFMPTPNVVLNVPVTSDREARFKSTVKQERDYSCGSAAVATLLTYHYDFPVTEHEVFTVMYRNGNQKQIMRDGFSLLDMKHYLDGEGFHADGYRLPLDELAKAEMPAIALINDDGYNHFVVIKGVTRDYVLLGDPAKGTRGMPRKHFEKIWNGLAFLLEDKPKLPGSHFNRAEEWRLVKLAPLDTIMPREGIAGLYLTLPGPYEF